VEDRGWEEDRGWGTSGSGPSLGASQSEEKEEKKTRSRASKLDFKTANQVYAPCFLN
jgi:hypothetical protein